MRETSPTPSVRRRPVCETTTVVIVRLVDRSVFRRLRENGPVVLVPLAWTFVTAVHLGLASEHALFVAHLVMAGIIVAFTVLSWTEMDAGVLLAWRRVLLAGLVVTLAGVGGFLVPPAAEVLFAVSVYGWMAIPTAGLAYTGRRVPEAGWVYLAGAVLGGLGLVGYAVGSAGGWPVVTVAGLGLVTAGQTAGIAEAVYRY